MHKFLVTGASSGLGLAIALDALQRGHVVFGTGRNIKKAADQHPEFAQAGGKWLQLDLTAANIQEVVCELVEREDLDVLVNAAGYGIYGALEDMSEEEIRAQFETNFFGTIKVTKGVIPHFRQKRRGAIVMMSSISGLTLSMASGIMYSASKFALEALGEGLALQLKPFGIRLLIVEPGLFRTNWLVSSYATPAKGLGDDYVGGPVDSALSHYPTIHGTQEGDPAKAAKVIIDVATGTGSGAAEDIKGCLRLPLGGDAMDKAREYVDKFTKDLDIIDKVARSTAFDNGVGLGGRRIGE
ncbi:dehydrogenase with different specificitie [Rhizodiscina lignyota]|uniref:Dehydrogenase with different specificitie n=1 Tax=Rhizodiscina lignyota TaxID=1504668 RepID=A0A9P4I1I6_9PEZI|nr:dehydrogenase with different specificitie [Rhizodiscina lignyota]